MIIPIGSGDILETDATVVVNPVTGSGGVNNPIMERFKQQFPNNHKCYLKAISDDSCGINTPLIKNLSESETSLKICNICIVDHHHSELPDMNSIRSSLEVLRETLEVGDIVAIPQLGSLLDNVPVDSDESMIYEVFSGLGDDVVVYWFKKPKNKLSILL